jgi:ribosomal-protein-alanine N-acetyltransferase
MSVEDKTELVPLVAVQAPVLASIHAEGFDKPWPPEAFTRLLENPVRTGALALANDTPAGFIMVQQTPDESEILTLVVARNNRRAGIGKALLHWAIESAGIARCTRIILEVAESNEPARALYEGLGFTQIGARSGYYLHGQDVETALLLARSVVSPSSNR